MTAIIWKNNKLLVDSFVEKGGEWMEVSDKVFLVRREMQLISADGTFDDHILGLTYTGAKRSAEALGQALHLATLDYLESLKVLKAVNVGDVDPVRYTYEVVLKRYEQAQGLGLFNLENNFTVLLVGAKRVYEAMLLLDGGLRITPVADDEYIVMGSGGQHMLDLDRRHEKEATPIRMMHYAILMEPGCGGRISQFERVDDVRHPSGKVLELTGLYSEPDRMQLRVAELAAQIDIPPDLVLNDNGYHAKRRAGAGNDVAVCDPKELSEREQRAQAQDAELKAKVEQQAQRAGAAKSRKRSTAPAVKPVKKPTKTTKRTSR